MGRTVGMAVGCGIDVAVAAGTGEAVGLVENIKPYRLSPIYFKSHYAIELSPGVISASNTEIGDLIQILN